MTFDGARAGIREPAVKADLAAELLLEMWPENRALKDVIASEERKYHSTLMTTGMRPGS